MSVKMILSNTYEQAFYGVLRELRETHSSGRNVVLVPDKFSLSLERNILSKLGLKGSFNIEVMSFTRFATKSLKNNIKRCLTPEGSVMLMKKAINNVQPKLTVYKNAVLKNGFAREIYAVLTSVRNSGITAEELAEKGNAFFEEDKNLKQKLYDISIIYNEYLSLLENKHSDSSTRLQAFADFIPLMQDISVTNIYICDFYNFTAPQYDIVEKLIANAKSVTFGFVRTSDKAPNIRIYPKAHIENIKKLCELHNQQLKIIENDEILSDYKQVIATELFSYGVSKPVELNGEIQLNVASDIMAEVEFTAKNIRKLIIEKGLRYRDISLVVGDIDAYTMPIQNVFRRFDIPFFIDKKENFYEQPSIKFILYALNVVEKNFNPEAVLEMVKNPFFYIDNGGYESIGKFENYCLKMSINSHDILNGFTHGEESEVTVAENIRLKAVEILSPFTAEQSGQVIDYLNSLEKFFELTDFYNKIEAIPLGFSGTDEEFRRVSEQIEEKIKDIFFEMRLTIGEDKMSFKDFVSMLNSVFDSVKISLVPVYLDSVFVGEIKESRYDDVKVMFILGVLDGKIPVATADTPVISIKDEEKMSDAGLRIMPTKKENTKYELFYLTQLLIKPEQKIIISYPEHTGSGEAKPSVLISQLSALFTEKGEPLKIIPVVDETYKDNVILTNSERAKLYAYKFSTQKNAYYQLLANVANETPLPSKMEPYDAVWQLLDDDYKQKLNRYLMPKTNIKNNVQRGLLLSETFSASRLETYFTCPYKYYFSYGLYLKKREDGTLQTMDTGTIIHGVLEEYVNLKLYNTKDIDKIAEFADKTIDSIVAENRFSNMYTEAHKNAFERLKSECINICQAIGENIRNSDFKPYKTEAEVGIDAEFKGVEIEVGGRVFTLHGYIDRIDLCGDCFTIIDYKSYNKNLSAGEIFNGKCIQPVLYMLAVNGSYKKLYPCGLLYQPTTLGYKENAEDRFKMKGLVINDIDILSLMDNNITAGEKSKMLPVSFTPKGKIYPQCTSAIDNTDFISIGRYVYKLSAVAVNEIYDGNISPSPLKSSCKNCDYNCICLYADNEDYERKSFPKIRAGHFAKIINGEFNKEKLSESCSEVEND